MNPHVLDPSTDARYRALDAATPAASLDPARRAATLDAILATDPRAASAPLPYAGNVTVLAPRRRRSATRWVALAGAAATVTTAAIVLPGMGGDETAYASWTAEPSAVSDADLGKVTSACRAETGAFLGDLRDDPSPKAPSVPSLDAKDLPVRIAERRGDWIYLTLVRSMPDQTVWDVSCLAELPAGSGGKPAHLQLMTAWGGGFTAPSGHELIEGSISEFGGNDGQSSFSYHAPGPVDGGAGSIGSKGAYEPASSTSGWVGPDVTGVTIHVGDETVEASVEDGTFAAWWPGTVFDRPTPMPSDGDGVTMPDIRYDLTLKDGTVLTDIEPTEPVQPTDGSTEPGAAPSPAT